MSDYVANGRMQVGKTYYLINKSDTTRALNVWCSNTYPAANLSNVCLWNYSPNDIAQKWTLIENEKHYMLHSEKTSSKYLDLYTGNGAGNGANAHLYSASNTSYLVISAGTYGTDSVSIKLETIANKYLTANTGANGTRLGNMISSAGNVFFSTSHTPASEWIPVEVPENNQRLTLPIDCCKLTASYKNAAYKAKYSYTHYGVDMISTESGNKTIKASGNGTVKAYGWDSKAGNVVVIKYFNAFDKASGLNKNVVFRYFHLNSINDSLYVGMTVNKNTVLGVYGGSGMGETNHWPEHLHVEADTDTNYACYSPTFGTGGGIIIGTSGGANDSTCSSACNWLFIGNGQTYTTSGDSYINTGDGSLENV